MNRSRILAPWGIFASIVVLMVMPHSADAQAYPYTWTYTQLTDLHQQSRVGPSVTVDNNGMVYLAWAGTNGPQGGQAYLNIATSSDGINFGGAMNPLSSTDWSLSNAAPGITFFNGNIYYAWTGGSNHINISYAAPSTSLSGAFLAHKSLVNISGATQTAAGSVALAASNGFLYLAWGGTGNNLLNVAKSTDGTTWSKTTYGYSSPYSPSLAAGSTTVYMSWTASNQCLFLDVNGPLTTHNCSGTLPNGGGTYPYVPVLGTAGPGSVIYGGGLVSAYGACPNTPCNHLFLAQAGLSSNASVGYEVTPGIGVTGNPIILVRSGFNPLVYVTSGTEIQVASFSSLP